MRLTPGSSRNSMSALDLMFAPARPTPGGHITLYLVTPKGDLDMPDNNRRTKMSAVTPEATLDFRDQVGGEPLDGSGFENEIPEPEAEWRDPR